MARSMTHKQQLVRQTRRAAPHPSASAGVGLFPASHYNLIMRILIVEDDTILADGLSRSLRQAGYAVDVVSDGLEADTILASQGLDLLILVLGLPRLDGLEVLRRLRARDSHLPVLILTAADSIEQRVKGLDLGADDYMAKP